MQSVRKILCPRCGNTTEYSLDNKWRPFCCERCKMIDLGNWAAEEYRVPEEEKQKSGSEPDSSPS